MTNTEGMRQQLREALEELTDTISNLVNLLDSFEAAEEDSFDFAYYDGDQMHRVADTEPAADIVAR
jgi:predicted O-methyltransferase YrrM